MKKIPFDFVAPADRRPPKQQQSDFDQFEAVELYCNACGRAVPVKKSLILVLPEGDKYEYSCQFCGGKVGDKIDRQGQFSGIIRG